MPMLTTCELCAHQILSSFPTNYMIDYIIYFYNSVIKFFIIFVKYAQILKNLLLMLYQTYYRKIGQDQVPPNVKNASGFHPEGTLS